MAKQVDDSEEHEDDLREVKLPSDAPFKVHVSEETYFTDRVTRYLEDNKFTNVSDLQDLDRVIIGEVLIWRWGQWIMSGLNYWNEAVDDSALHKNIKELSAELRLVKASLNLDKVARDKQKGDDSPALYIENLGIRARAMGYKRNEEFNWIMEFFRELKGMVGYYDRMDDQERRTQHVNPETIFAWMREEFVKFEEIDAKFRTEGPLAQQAWIREM